MGFHAEFFWRTTGIPWDVMDGLACHTVGAEIDHLLRRTGAADRPWAAVESDVVSRAEASGLIRRLRGEFAVRRAALAKVAADDDLREFVSQTSAQALAVLIRVAGRDPDRPRNSAARRDERLVVRYLQRAVGRCETVSRFGPVARGRFGDFPRPLDHDFDPGYRPTAFASYRWVDTICRSARRRPEVFGALDVRTTQGLLPLGDGVWWHPAHSFLAPGPRLDDLLGEGRRRRIPIRELRRRYGQEIDTGLHLLLRHGLIWDRLSSALVAPQPSRVLLRVLEACGTAPDLVDLTARIEGLRLRWPALSPQGRQAAVARVTAAADVCGIVPPARGTYSDHLPVYEDGLAPGRRLRVDRTWAEPYLTTIGDYLLDRADSADPQPADPQPADRRPVVWSPDVMIGTTRDTTGSDVPLWVLSEVHRSLSPVSFPERHLPDARAARSRTGRFLAGTWPGRPLVAFTTVPMNKTHHLGPVPGVRYLEVGSPWAGDPAQLADEAWLDRLRSGLRSRLDSRLDSRLGSWPDARLPGSHLLGTDEPVLLPAPLQLAAELADVVPPAPAERVRRPPPDGCGPRVTYGGVVVARMRRDFPAELLPGRSVREAELLLWSRHLRARHHLPRLVFLRRAEHKPVLIDLDDVVCVEELVHLRRHDPAAIMHLEEMLPTPEQALAATPDGRYLSELRLLFAGSRG